MTEINNYCPDTCKKFYGELSPYRYKELKKANIGRIRPQDYLQAKASKYIIEGRLNGTWAVDLAVEPLGDFMGTIFSALQFACYTLPKRIFLVGCDCSSDGHFHSDENIPKDLTYQVALWKRLDEFIKNTYPDIEIISVNPVGLKGMFHDVYTKEYIAEHPDLQTQNIEILD